MPPIGHIVQFKMSANVADAIMDARSEQTEDRFQHRLHGNEVRAGQIVAMVIVCVHSEQHINGQLILDGNHGWWVTSVERGDDPGQWQGSG